MYFYIIDIKYKIHKNMVMAENKIFYDFSMEDFKEIEKGDCFLLNKPCIVFNQEINTPTLEIKINRNYREYVYQINKESIKAIIEYINWLGNCKEELIKFYCNTYNKIFIGNKKMTIEKLIEKKWYEELNIQSVEIVIEENKLFSEIYCYNWDYKINKNKENKIGLSIEIKTEDFNITSMDIWE